MYIMRHWYNVLFVMFYFNNLPCDLFMNDLWSIQANLQYKINLENRCDALCRITYVILYRKNEITNITRVKIHRDSKHKIQCMSRRYQDMKTLIYKTAKYLYSINREKCYWFIISETIDAIEYISLF